MYPSPPPNHSHMTQEHKDTPLESVIFVNFIHCAVFWASLVEHNLNRVSEGGSGMRQKGL